MTVSAPVDGGSDNGSPIDQPEILVPAPHHDRFAALINLALLAYDVSG